MGGLVTECLSWRGGLSLSVAHGGCHKVSLMGGFVTECGENIDRRQLDAGRCPLCRDGLEFTREYVVFNFRILFEDINLAVSSEKNPNI